MVFLKIGTIDTIHDRYSAEVLLQSKWHEPRLDGKHLVIFFILFLTPYTMVSVFLSICLSVYLSACFTHTHARTHAHTTRTGHIVQWCISLLVVDLDGVRIKSFGRLIKRFLDESIIIMLILSTIFDDS